MFWKTFLCVWNAQNTFLWYDCNWNCIICLLHLIWKEFTTHIICGRADYLTLDYLSFFGQCSHWQFNQTWRSGCLQNTLIIRIDFVCGVRHDEIRSWIRNPTMKVEQGVAKTFVNSNIHNPIDRAKSEWLCDDFKIKGLSLHSIDRS